MVHKIQFLKESSCFDKWLSTEFYLFTEGKHSSSLNYRNLFFIPQILKQKRTLYFTTLYGFFGAHIFRCRKETIVSDGHKLVNPPSFAQFEVFKQGM